MAGIGVVQSLINQTLEQLGITVDGVFTPGGGTVFGDTGQMDILQLGSTGTEIFEVSAGVVGIGAQNDGSTTDGVLDLSGGGTITGIKLPVGSATNPAIKMGGAGVSGIFTNAGGTTVNFQVDGVNTVGFNKTSIDFVVDLQMNGKDVAMLTTGEVTWDGDTFLGSGSVGTLRIGATTNSADGTLQVFNVTLGNDLVVASGGQLDLTSAGGNAGAPSIKGGGGNDGFFFASGQVNIATGGLIRAGFTLTQFDLAVNLDMNGNDVQMTTTGEFTWDADTFVGSLAVGEIFIGATTQVADGVLNLSGGGTATSLKLGAGSATTPAIAHAADGNTGIYFGTDAIFFVANASAIFQIRTSAGGGLFSATSADMFGFTRFVEAHTEVAAAPHVIGATSDNMLVFTNEGTGAAQHQDLPTAAAGLTYTFIVQDPSAFGMVINAATGDTIRIDGSVSSAGGTATATVQGSSVTLCAINATEWLAIAIVEATAGDWALA